MHVVATILLLLVLLFGIVSVLFGLPGTTILFLAALGVASILNTFSHFHTPFLISLFRTLNGALLGLALGLIGVILVRRLWRWWWG